MKNVLHYKGYSARPEYSAEDQIFYGKILGIDDITGSIEVGKCADILVSNSNPLDDFRALQQVPIKSAYLCLVCEGFLNFHCLSSPNF